MALPDRLRVVFYHVSTKISIVDGLVRQLELVLEAAENCPHDEKTSCDNCSACAFNCGAEYGDVQPSGERNHPPCEREKLLQTVRIEMLTIVTKYAIILSVECEKLTN